MEILKEIIDYWIEKKSFSFKMNLFVTRSTMVNLIDGYLQMKTENKLLGFFDKKISEDAAKWKWNKMCDISLFFLPLTPHENKIQKNK